MPTEEAVKKWGAVGSAIPGSRYYRDYCTRCSEPMRVEEDRVGDEHFCSECDPPHMGVGNATPGMGLDKDPDAYEPAWKAGN